MNSELKLLKKKMKNLEKRARRLSQDALADCDSIRGINFGKNISEQVSYTEIRWYIKNMLNVLSQTDDEIRFSTLREVLLEKDYLRLGFDEHHKYHQLMDSYVKGLELPLAYELGKKDDPRPDPVVISVNLNSLDEPK